MGRVGPPTFNQPDLSFPSLPKFWPPKTCHRHHDSGLFLRGTKWLLCDQIKFSHSNVKPTKQQVEQQNYQIRCSQEQNIQETLPSWGAQNRGQLRKAKNTKSFLEVKTELELLRYKSWLLSPSGKCIWRCVCICICICISICNVFVFVIIFVAVGVGLQHNQSGGSVAVGHDGAKVGRISIIDWTKAAPVFFSLLIFQFSIYRILSLSFCLSVQCRVMWWDQPVKK